MRVPVDWLRDYCDADWDVARVAEALTMAGLEVEEIEGDGDRLAIVTEVTSNRPDLLSIVGVARELSALSGRRLKMPTVRLSGRAADVGTAASVTNEAPDLCPRYTARVIEDVAVGPSPPWLVRRLESAGLRSINNVVDVTNYVLYEIGQPLHAFDLEKLRGGRIVVRRGRPGERMTAIDGTRCALDDSMLVIADESRAVAIAGVMGGLDTEIGDGTTRVLLESACFDPLSVRATGRRLGLASDSSFRFERGVDPERIEWASRRAAQLIAELAGGRVLKGVIDDCHLSAERRVVPLRRKRVARILGYDIPRRREIQILARLGFRLVAKDREKIEVEVPSYRAEVEREIDLIEELARVEGYDKVPHVTQMRVALGGEPEVERVRRFIAGRLVESGFCETVTFSFVQPRTTERCSVWPADGTVLVPKAFNANENALRRTLIPSLAAVKALNLRRGVSEVRLFETARVFLPSRGEKLPHEKRCLAMLDDKGLRSLRGVLEDVLCGIAVAASARPADFDVFEKGCALAFRDDAETLVGVAGLLRDDLCEANGFRQAPAAAEFDLDYLCVRARLIPRYAPVPRLPGVSRDLALVLERGVPWADVAGTIRAADEPLLQGIEFVSEYAGEQLAPHEKSMAVRLLFRHPDRTLRAEEVSEAQGRLFCALAEKLGARLREE